MARYGHSPHSSMQHLNGNLLCAVDVETTGLDPAKHDLIQICILPLDANIKPIKIMPFYMNMKPKRPETINRKAMTVSNLSLVQLLRTAIDPWDAVDLLDEWFNRLHLPVGKKLVPLAHNWVFDRQFILEWLGGPKSFEYYFDYHYRDSFPACSYLNDRADAHCEPIPFPHIGLAEVCSKTGVQNLKAHDALQDCIATAENYRRLLTYFTPLTVGRRETPPEYII